VALKELGFALSEAERLLDEVDVDELRGMLRVRRAELEAQIAEDHARLDRVAARLRAIEQEDDMPDDVSIKSLPAQRVAAVARPAPGLGLENVGAVNKAAFRDLSQALERSGVQGHRPYFACYTGDEEDGTLMHLHRARDVARGARVRPGRRRKGCVPRRSRGVRGPLAGAPTRRTRTRPATARAREHTGIVHRLTAGERAPNEASLRAGRHSF
jgi:DNA-binding transcriptional MerR regulator